MGQIEQGLEHALRTRPVPSSSEARLRFLLATHQGSTRRVAAVLGAPHWKLRTRPGLLQLPGTPCVCQARRIQHLTEEIGDLNQRIAEAVKASSPGLLDVRGVGPDSAAALLIAAGDNPERLTGEASFAALCGTSPVEASSGKTQRRRLNRGGDRQANAALYRIVLSRLRWDDRTRNYLQRRLAEGKTRREVIRCLKRYIAREVYRLLATPSPAASRARAATAT
ncbi:transposase [Streptomyces sp. GD-15H]